MYSFFLKLSYALENNKLLSSMRKSFVSITPVLITGSFALLFLNLPIAAVNNFLNEFCGGFLARSLHYVFDSTSGFISVFLVLSISFYCSEAFAQNNFMLRMMSMITSFACFIASFGGESGSLTIGSFYTTGIFTALVCSTLATYIFFKLHRFFNKRTQKYNMGSDNVYQSSVTAILPFLICVGIFVTANLMLSELLGYGNFNELISDMFTSMFGLVSSELGGGMLYTLLLNLLWVFGIHGGNILDPVATTLFVDGGPSTIISKSFMDNFAQMGGGGATICLLLAIFIAARSRTSKQLARSASPMVLFNINELLMFGFPIVLNPIMLFPFVIVPPLALLISFLAVKLGIMPPAVNSVAWTTPVLLSGYLSTGSMIGSFVQMFTIALGTMIYIPFVRFSEKLAEGRSSHLLKKLTDEFMEVEKSGAIPSLLGRNDDLGTLANEMASQLGADIKDNKIQLFYQPQVNREGSVSGAEALLRWSFSGIGVYPPLVIALAREKQILEELTLNILNRACNDIKELAANVNPEISVAVNVVAEQLNDRNFISQVVKLANSYGICKNLSLEVTEETSLQNFPNITSNIDFLRESGIPMSIDDFSMGHTSINYLKTSNFRCVKLDGSLVRQLTTNSRCHAIVSSIIDLGKSLGFTVTAEYVETPEIQAILFDLGCDLFQGYLYSPALRREEFSEFCSKFEAEQKSRTV